MIRPYSLPFDAVNVVDQLALLGLVLLRQHIEVAARDALRVVAFLCPKSSQKNFL